MDQAPGALSLPLASPDEREAALYARLKELGIAWTTHVHASVFTVAEAAALYASQPGGHTKNLFLKDKKDGLWLVVARDALKIDLNELAKALGTPRFSFGSGELLIAALGVEPGSVTPFARYVGRPAGGKERRAAFAFGLAIGAWGFASGGGGAGMELSRGRARSWSSGATST